MKYLTALLFILTVFQIEHCAAEQLGLLARISNVATYLVKFYTMFDQQTLNAKEKVSLSCSSCSEILTIGGVSGMLLATALKDLDNDRHIIAMQKLNELILIISEYTKEQLETFMVSTTQILSYTCFHCKEGRWILKLE